MIVYYNISAYNFYIFINLRKHIFEINWFTIGIGAIILFLLIILTCPFFRNFVSLCYAFITRRRRHDFGANGVFIIKRVGTL